MPINATSDARRDLYRRRFEFLATQATLERAAKEEDLTEDRGEAKIEDSRKFKTLGVGIDIIAQATECRLKRSRRCKIESETK